MKEISINEFKTALEKESANTSFDFINVCTPAEYAEKSIPGARSVPLDTLLNHLDDFKNKKAILIHCMSGNRSKRAMELLQNAGITADIMSVAGGLLAWEKAGFPTHTSTHRMPLMRQVLLTAGLFVALSIILSILVHPNFQYVALFVGCGQMFAGLTGWCGLSYFLEKMPWNK
jgi:rhodanese-related sulfurtransferase